jgi:GGDEF domain-containing protein
VAAHGKALRLCDAVASTQLSWKGEIIPISVAFGAHRLVAGEEPQVALAAADRAMYRHKRDRSRGGPPAVPAGETGP